jgi:hypothetical protein
VSTRHDNRLITLAFPDSETAVPQMPHPLLTLQEKTKQIPFKFGDIVNEFFRNDP